MTAPRLHFGTAGLRGPVGAGPAAMNGDTVAQATAAVGTWLRQHGYGGGDVVVGRDGRHGSEEFFAVTCAVLRDAGLRVVALPEPAPTPLVAFATRHLNAAAGIQITASHNPPADNGYKVYLAGGAQIIPPVDAEIEALMATATDGAPPLGDPITPDARALANRADYLARLAQRFPAVSPPSELRIALTAMHGVGGELAVQALAQAGFPDVTVVAAQQDPDGDFPTVPFPNPEEPGAADLLLALAADIDADIAIALDPDADRCAVGVAVDGAWRLLTGDETGALLGDVILRSLPEADRADAIVANTIVSGDLLGRIATGYGAHYRRTLTGFKWLVRAAEGTDGTLVYAYEEAIGHCVDPVAVTDKDGISAAVALANLAAEWRGRGGLPAALDAIFDTHGVQVTSQHAVRMSIPAADALTAVRAAPITELGGITLETTDWSTHADALAVDALELTGSNAEGFALRVMIRGSGTEPKLKCYLQVDGPAAAGAGAREAAVALLARATSDISVATAGFAES